MKQRRKQRPSRRITLHDVAAVAGCSTATVSRVLNRKESASPAVQAKIASAVKKLGYLPNGSASALRSQRTRIIGAVIPTINYAIYAKLVESLEQTLNAHGYSLLLTTCDYDPKKELEKARILLARGAEGFVFIGDSHDTELYRFLADYRTPYINTYVYNPESGHPCVGIDNETAAAQAANYLCSIGHSRIAVIAGYTGNNDRQAARVMGVRAALQANRLVLDEGNVVERPHLIEGGREAVRLLLQSPNPPTGVICGSDVLAFGALFECIERGANVPGQISIVGFDDQDFAQYLHPGLTTVAVPATEMGHRAAEYILARLDGGLVTDCTRLESRLIVRGTTAQYATVRAK